MRFYYLLRRTQTITLITGLLFFLSNAGLLKAQLGFNNQGCYVNIQGGTSLHVDGNITLGTNGQFNNSGEVEVKGDWANNSGNTAFVNSNNGSVKFSGANQSVGGTSATTFHDINLVGTGTKTLSNASQLTINGSLTVGVSGTSNVVMINQHSSSVFTGGNFTVNSGSTYQENGAGFNIQGNVSIYGTYTGAKNLLFTGSNTQTIAGAVISGMKNLTINKSAGLVFLNTTITIDSILTLTQGRIISSSTNLLTFNNGSTVTGSSNTSFVSGPIKKIGNSAFTFPIGDTLLTSSNAYHPLTITAPSVTTDAFTAQYYARGQTDGSTIDNAITNLSNCEYWNLSRTTGTSNVSATLGWNANSCNIVSPSNTHIAYWDATTSTWKDKGGINPTGTVTTGTITSSAAQSSFGHFTLARLSDVTSYFRSAQSGNWNQTSTWQSSSDNTNWVAASAVPDFNANTITIQSAHTVTITASTSIDQTIVNGTLIYGDSTGNTLTLNNGTGADLIINGTFQDIGPNSVVWSSSATWSMGTSGTIIRTKGTSSNNWRDNYDGGISTIPATSNWIIRKTGTNSPALTSVGGMYYPNLIIENNTGTTWSTTSTPGFTGSSATPTIKGNLDIGGNGTGTVSFISDNSYTSPVLVNGNLSIKTGSTLRSYGTGFEVQGNLVNNGTIDYGTGSAKFVFSGAANQTISGTGTISFINAQVNKTTSSASVTLQSPATVTGLLTFTNGAIVTTSANLLTLASTASITGAGNNSFVSGSIKKIGNTAFTFPLGDVSITTGAFHPLTITAPSASTDAFTTQYYASGQTDGSAIDNIIANLSSCEYWNLSRTTGTSNVSVTLGWNTNSCNINSLPNTRIAYWDGTTSSWKDKGGINTTGTLTTGTITTASAQSNFGHFTLAQLSDLTSYFRSAQSGNWNQLSTWQSSTDNTTWGAASTSPNYTSNTITIQSAHTVTITASTTIDQTVVNGTLIYGDNSGSTLSINNGTGVDLSINGTFQDVAPNSISWGSGATWNIGSNGTLIRTRSTTSDSWRDNYDGGIITIPTTANWIIRKTGTDSPTLSSVGGMYYPNLTIENNSGSAWTTDTASSFTGSSDYTRVTGNFNIGGSGTNPVIFINQNTNATPVLIQGNLIVQNGSTLQNSGTGFNLKSNLTISGNYTGIKNLLFTGANTQIISGSTISGLKQLAINKSFGNVVLNTTVTIDSLLILTKGRILSSSTNLLVFNNGASVSGSSDTSYVSGPVQKVGNTAFTFPLGDTLLPDSSAYHPLTITAPTLATDVYSAQYFAVNQTYGSTIQTDSLESISNCEYWLLTRSVGTSVVKPSISWNSNSCNVGNLDNLRLSAWDGSNWKLFGNAAVVMNGNTGTLIGSIGLNLSSLPILIANSTIEILNTTIPLTDAGADKVICPGQEVQLEATGADAYSWYPETGINNTGISNPIASPDTTTMYYVVGTNGDNTVTDSVLVTVRSTPQLVITNSIYKICPGQNVTLTTTGTGTFNWQPYTGLSDTTSSSPTSSPTESVGYTVVLTDNNGCSTSGNVDVIVVAISLTTPDTLTIEKGKSVKLWASANTQNLSWSPSTGLSIPLEGAPTANPDSTITYTVTGTLDGCTSQSTTVVNVLESPMASYTYTFPGLDVQFFTNNTLSASYSWDFGDGGSSTNPTPVHTYSMIGDFNVCLEVSNTLGKEKYCDQINVRQ